ncbi:hypothetical protein D1872_246960 [compost metagenome]
MGILPDQGNVRLGGRNEYFLCIDPRFHVDYSLRAVTIRNGIDCRLNTGKLASSILVNHDRRCRRRSAHQLTDRLLGLHGGSEACQPRNQQSACQKNLEAA